MNKTERTAAVLERYMDAYSVADLDRMIDVYDDDAFLATPHGVLRGKQELAGFLEALIQRSPEGFFSSVKIIRRHISGETAHSTYSAAPFMNMGSNTWRVKGSKIVSQTYTFSKSLEFLEDVFANSGRPSGGHEQSPLTDHTRATIEGHLAAFARFSGEAIAANFSEDGFLSTPYGVASGREAIAAFFNNAFEKMPQQYMTSVERVFDHIEADTAYTAYRAEPFVSIGTDTWHVANGEIASQTYTAYPALDDVKGFFSGKAD